MSLGETIINVLIVGCGNIAGGFDFYRENATLPLTHAGAYFRDNRFKILACVDPDLVKRQRFKDRWNIEFSYECIDDALHSGNSFDVVSICSPTSVHYSDLTSAIKYSPRLIFCEKPLAETLKLSEDVVMQCEKRNIPLLVNYSRRFDSSLQQLKLSYDNGEYGELRSISGIYNKGILNNGSHLIDLLINLFGSMELCWVGSTVYDYDGNDPTIPFTLKTKSGVFVMVSCANANDYSFFELQFVFSKGVLLMQDGGLRWQKLSLIESQFFSGYKVLDRHPSYLGGYQNAMTMAVDNIYSFLEEKQPLLSDGANSIKVQQLCNQILLMS